MYDYTESYANNVKRMPIDWKHTKTLNPNFLDDDNTDQYMINKTQNNDKYFTFTTLLPTWTTFRPRNVKKTNKQIKNNNKYIHSITG